jgi:hypothetical protein
VLSGVDRRAEGERRINPGGLPLLERNRKCGSVLDCSKRRFAVLNKSLITRCLPPPRRSAARHDTVGTVAVGATSSTPRVRELGRQK